MDFFGFLQAIKNTLQFAALREVYCTAAGTIVLSTFSVTHGMLFLHTNTTFELFILIIQSVQSKLTFFSKLGLCPDFITSRQQNYRVLLSSFNDSLLHATQRAANRKTKHQVTLWQYTGKRGSKGAHVQKKGRGSKCRTKKMTETD